jgi:nucleoside-diphosphate-sugar epimerase
MTPIVVVTGADGLVGGHVVGALSQRGATVCDALAELRDGLRS